MIYKQLPPLENGFYQLGDKDHPDHHDSSESKVFGFWVYLMTDCILFASLFATYAVLQTGIADGPSAKEIFELPFVLTETALLLVSSLTFGLAMIAAYSKNMAKTMQWLVISGVLGVAFLAMEIYEFHHFIVSGYGPTESAFLSAFFALVGTHGLHVLTGVIWLAVMLVLLRREGFNTRNMTRLRCLALFWHFLDVIWICVFSLVYLSGAA